MMLAGNAGVRRLFDRHCSGEVADPPTFTCLNLVRVNIAWQLINRDGVLYSKTKLWITQRSISHMYQLRIPKNEGANWYFNIVTVKPMIFHCCVCCALSPLPVLVQLNARSNGQLPRASRLLLAERSRPFEMYACRVPDSGRSAMNCVKFAFQLSVWPPL